MTETRSLTGKLLCLVMLGLCWSAVAEEGEGKAEVIEVPGATLGRMGDPVGVDPETFNFSEAEARLWLSDHLKNITRPARLYYQFTKAGSFEEGFSDSVYLDILELNPDGSKKADLQFFSGDREQPFTPENVTNVRGNPVLGVFMRGDVHDMNRLTQGNWRYFQHRIKAAFADGAVIDPVSVTFDGQTLPAQRISITPFIHDARRGQFAQFTDKRYEFLLSDEIPGTLYQIRTVVPGAANETQPLLEETLTLERVEYGG